MKLKKSRIKRILESAKRYLRRGFCTGYLIKGEFYGALSEIRNKVKLAKEHRSKDCKVCVNGALLLASPKYCSVASRYLNKLAKEKGYRDSYELNDRSGQIAVLEFLNEAISNLS